MKFNISDGQHIELKDKITWGERRRLAAQNPALKTQDGENADPELTNAWAMQIVMAVVVSWSLGTDLTTENLENTLTGDEGERLLEECLILCGFRSREDSDKKKKS